MSAVGGEAVSGHRAGKQARLWRLLKQADRSTGREGHSPSSFTRLEFPSVDYTHVHAALVISWSQWTE